MKKIIHITATDKKFYTIFVSHISHIERTTKGCIIYLSGLNTPISTNLSWKELEKDLLSPNASDQ